MVEQRQLSLLGPDEREAPQEEIAYRDHLVFKEPDPHKLYMGMQHLDEYLAEAGIRAPLVVAEVLSGLDWKKFEARYKRGGRAPYAPRLMMGLVLYGLMRGIDSLRGLEELARTDLGCMWVTGAIKPDHSVIGRFINLHKDQIGGRFFDDLTKAVLRRTRSSGAAVAGDGTVIQAAASRLKTLKKEALAQRLAREEEQQRQNPDDPKSPLRIAQTKRALEVLNERAAKREAHSKDGTTTRVSVTEPETAVQKLKNKSCAPAYKPSVVANEARVVVGYDLDVTNEAGQIPTMLAMAERISGEKVSMLMTDAGYNTNEMLSFAVKNDINLLCPEGRAGWPGGEMNRQRKLFDKSAFVYDSASDTYRCQAGQTLFKQGSYSGNKQYEGWSRYRTGACATCPLRAKCTTSKQGRQVKRFAGDEAREALRQVMEQPGARKQYGQRKAWVEPVFSELRGNQCFNRFRRRGKMSVTLEWAMHLAAYNLSRAVAWTSREAYKAICKLFGLIIALILPSDVFECGWVANLKEECQVPIAGLPMLAAG